LFVCLVQFRRNDRYYVIKKQSKKDILYVYLFKLMIDVYQTIREQPGSTSFVYDDLLFAEFGCSETRQSVEIMSPVDHIVYVISGKKTWHSQFCSATGEAGGAVFLKKGARVMEQFFDKQFCFMVFFFTDDFVKSVLSELGDYGSNPPVKYNASRPNIQLNVDSILSSFFRSMAEYFVAELRPNELLLRLKFKEFITSIVVSDNNNELKKYFQSLAHINTPRMNHIMEENYLKNLSIAEYAKLCHRSVSSFKRDFKEEFSSSPGKWVADKRLEYSVALLSGTQKSISEIMFESGFVNLSHYSKSFKNKFGVSPSTYRKAKIA